MGVPLGDFLRHYLNPLHMYCRLRGIGCCKAKALQLIGLYEIWIYWIFKERNND